MKDNYRKKPAFWNKHSYIIGFFKQNLQKRNHPHTPRKVKPRQCFKKLTNCSRPSQNFDGDIIILYIQSQDKHLNTALKLSEACWKSRILESTQKNNFRGGAKYLCVLMFILTFFKWRWKCWRTLTRLLVCLVFSFFVLFY